MQVCAQCNGKKATQGLESISDLSGNTENVAMFNQAPAPGVCSQCNGNGFQYS